MSVDGEVRRLRKDLAKLRAASPGDIARRLPAFRCTGCARCCRAAFGDNTVTLFPGEIRAIMRATGLEWLQVAEPEEVGDVDRYGNRHAFEWALRKKPDGDCIFLDGGRCSIYDLRPRICRTYPFFLEGKMVQACECDGLGEGNMDGPEADAMARELIARHADELEESIALLDRLDMEAGRSHRGLILVHDGEGTRLVCEKDGRQAFYGEGPR
jgi:hypothetical protein